MFKFKKITIFTSGLILLLTFTAFGCKKDESATEESDDSSTVQSNESITYNQTEEQTNDNSSEEAASEEEGENNNNNSNSTNTSEAANDTSESEKSDDDKLLLEQAEKLAEIFGTFTNKDKESYNNLKELKEYSTEKLQEWLDEKSSIPIDSQASFYGVTTEVMSSVILEKSSKKSKILITAKREEITSASSSPKVSYKVLLMLFNKVKEDWKLDGLYWQD